MPQSVHVRCYQPVDPDTSTVAVTPTCHPNPRKGERLVRWAVGKKEACIPLKEQLRIVP